MRSNRFLDTSIYCGITAIFVAGAMYIPEQYNKFQLKARSKEGLTLLSSADIALQATRAEQGYYETDLEKNGFNPAGALHYSVSLNEENLDSDMKSFLPKSYYPFVTKDAYQIFVGSKIRTNTYHICKQGSHTKRECLWITAEIDEE